LGLLRAGEGAHRKAAARRQAEGVDQQEAVFRLGGHGGLLFQGYAALFKISAIFSPTMIEGALVLPEGMVGKIEASATRRPSRPCTFNLSSTTVPGPAGPMRQVPTGW